MKRKYKTIILCLTCLLVICSCYLIVNKIRVSPFIVKALFVKFVVFLMNNFINLPFFVYKTLRGNFK